ncbi:hypothetical protein J6590_019484 [Homalodisca vitripennis]|nr:hypothetical protein J6590_019484 [Homalodisca vitripennis]
MTQIGSSICKWLPPCVEVRGCSPHTQDGLLPISVRAACNNNSIVTGAINHHNVLSTKAGGHYTRSGQSGETFPPDLKPHLRKMKLSVLAGAPLSDLFPKRRFVSQIRRLSKT